MWEFRNDAGGADEEQDAVEFLGLDVVDVRLGSMTDEAVGNAVEDRPLIRTVPAPYVPTPLLTFPTPPPPLLEADLDLEPEDRYSDEPPAVPR